MKSIEQLEQFPDWADAVLARTIHHSHIDSQKRLLAKLHATMKTAYPEGAVVDAAARVPAWNRKWYAGEAGVGMALERAGSSCPADHRRASLSREKAVVIRAAHPPLPQGRGTGPGQRGRERSNGAGRRAG